LAASLLIADHVGDECSNVKGRSWAFHPDLTKTEKSIVRSWPLLVLDVPMTKDGPGHFILI
jgi:hypothetical protein